MEISIIFKIAALGIVITVLGQVLKHSGREEIFNAKGAVQEVL